MEKNNLFASTFTVLSLGRCDRAISDISLSVLLLLGVMSAVIFLVHYNMYLPNALNRATISVLTIWNGFFMFVVTVESNPTVSPEKRIFSAVPIPVTCKKKIKKKDTFEIFVTINKYESVMKILSVERPS